MLTFKRPATTSRKVNFVVAGTQKGGTTALEKYLGRHPSISMASQKEVHFFDNESTFKAETDYSAYHSYFEIDTQDKLLGEATPIYMYWYDAPRRIWQYNPNMKFIIVLRNPIERAFSHWNMERERGFDKLPFWDAIASEEERCREALPLQHRTFSYIDRGYYTEQLRRIWHFFPKRQTLIIKNEELRNAPNDKLKEVSEFLAIDRFANIEHEEIHSRQYLISMSDAERDYLKEKFFWEIKELESLLGWDCTEWLK